MKYHDLLDLAHSIYKECDSEAARRTVVSRAYYSVFYPARDLKQAHQLKARGSEHEGLVAALRSRGDFRALGNALDMIRKNRITADYHLDNAVSARDARAALSKARRLHDEIAKFSR